MCVHNLSKCVFIDARAACACVRAFACVCLRVYLSVYNMYARVCVHIYVFVCVHIHVFVCVRVCVPIYVFVYVCLYMRLCMRACLYMCVFIRAGSLTLLTALTQTNFNCVHFFNARLTLFWLGKRCSCFTCCLATTSHIRKTTTPYRI